MKKALKIITFIMATLLVCTVFASCGTVVIGKYTGQLGGNLIGTKATYNFKAGGKVTITVSVTLLGTVSSDSYDGTFRLAKADDGTQSITFTFTDSEATEYSGTYTFEKGDGYIKLGGVTYTKE